MTTIAYDGHSISGDTQATDEAGFPLKIKKVFKQGDFIFGTSGYTSASIRFKKYAMSGVSFDHIVNNSIPDFKNDESVHVIIANKDSAFVSIGSEFIPIKAPHAIGSGRDFALAAMDLGKNSHEAVLLASKFDVGTNDVIDTQSLDMDSIDHFPDIGKMVSDSKKIVNEIKEFCDRKIIECEMVIEETLEKGSIEVKTSYALGHINGLIKATKKIRSIIEQYETIN